MLAPINVAILQLKSAANDKNSTCENMKQAVKNAADDCKSKGQELQMAILPEIWNSRNGPGDLIAGAEPVPDVGEEEADWDADAFTVRAMADAARSNGVWLVGGSIMEIRDGKRYNCLTVYNPEGRLVAKYRKTHLFDVCLPTMTYRESDTITPGDALVTFDTPFGKFGVGLCYDIRFAEIAVLAARKGCMAMIYPAAFSKPTGELHWELLQRARALDNQIYVLTASSARDLTTPFIVYGHSIVTDPMGKILVDGGLEEGIVHVQLDTKAVSTARQHIPLYAQRRFDLYPDISAVTKTNGTL